MLAAFIVTCLALTASTLPVTPGPGAQGAELPAQSTSPPEPAGQQPGPQVLVQIHPNQQGQSQQQQPITVANQLPETLHLPQYYLPMHHQPPWFPHSGLPMGMPFQPAMQQPFQPHFQPHFQPAMQPVQQPIQQPVQQPIQQPALQTPLHTTVQGAQVPFQPNPQAQHPMMVHPYGYFPFYPPLQGSQQYTPYRYPMMYHPASPVAPEVQVNPAPNTPANPAPNAPVNPAPAPPANPVAAGEALVQGAGSPPAAQPTEQQQQQQQQQPQPQNPHIVYMVRQPMTAQLGGLSSEELEMVVKLSKRGLFLPNLQPNVGHAGRPVAPPQVEAPEDPNEGPVGLEGPRRWNPGPPAIATPSSSSRAPGATPGPPGGQNQPSVRSGTHESNNIKHP